MLKAKSTQPKLFQFGIQKLKERIDTEGQQIFIVDDSRSGEEIQCKNLPLKKWLAPACLFARFWSICLAERWRSPISIGSEEKGSSKVIHVAARQSDNFNIEDAIQDQYSQLLPKKKPADEESEE
jgi:hypothetical protein